MRGRYRILLGMAAGVGKSYRMLLEGREAKERGVDVVIGYLEPHDRPETIALAEGLEVVPRSRVDHDRLVVEEMDVDAILRRAPELALVDELAHTNARESRNVKRYEDIDEILDAGIDVTSTVNVQHLESLNDAVFELTGVRVRETFPDRILDKADQVVLVDITPEELQERLYAGKVYPKERAEAALLNFFRYENLASLRELALLEVAEDVEARRAPRIFDPLGEKPVAERILALITPQARSQRLMRRAWRSAQRLSADMDVLWVRRPDQKLAEEAACPADRAAPARRRARRPFPGRGVGRLRRGRPRGRGRPRDDIRLPRHAGQPPPRGGGEELPRHAPRQGSSRRGHQDRRRPDPPRGARARKPAGARRLTVRLAVPPIAGYPASGPDARSRESVALVDTLRSDGGSHDNRHRTRTRFRKARPAPSADRGRGKAVHDPGELFRASHAVRPART